MDLIFVHLPFFLVFLNDELFDAFVVAGVEGGGPAVLLVVETQPDFGTPNIASGAHEGHFLRAEA